MPMEPLTGNLNKKTGAEREAASAIPAESTEKKETGLKERYEQLIIRHAVPDKPEYSHKREQLYLMAEQELSDAFIGKVIDFSSRMIDRLRMAVFITGEEFLGKQLTADEPSEEQIREWIGEYIKTTADPAQIKPADQSIERSLDIMGRHMVRQQEIASAQITRLTEYIRQFNEMDRDRNERDMHEMRAEHQKERESAQKQIDLLSDENFRLNMKIEETQDAAWKQTEGERQAEVVRAAAGPDPVMGYLQREESIFTSRRRRKERKRREDFIASVLGNGDFSKEQLAVIGRIVQKDFSLTQLQKICDPKVKPENMELLEAYYERRQMHG